MHMLGWLRKRRKRRALVEAWAKALIRDLGGNRDAYGEARRMEREADDLTSAKHWNRTALAIARTTDRCIGMDTATRMAVDEDFSDRSEPMTPPRKPLRKVDPIAELERILRQGK
jgi:hypothetical protein